MKNISLNVGDVVVKSNWNFRQILGETSLETGLLSPVRSGAQYRTFIRQTRFDREPGSIKPGGFGVCSFAHLERWADRMATDEELALIAPWAGRLSDEEMATSRDMVEKMLFAATDDLLLAEVRRRGLAPEDEDEYPA